MKRSVIAAAILSLTVSQALASNSNGWYAGVGAGWASANVSKDDRTTTADKVDKNVMGAKTVMGYQYNQNFALQGSYMYMGNNKYKSTTAASNGAFSTNVLSTSIVGLLPLSDKLDAQVGLGVYRTFVHLDSNLTFRDSSDKPDDEWGLTYSLGAKYDVTPAFSVGVAWDQLLEGAKNSMLSGNLYYYFGG